MGPCSYEYKTLYEGARKVCAKLGGTVSSDRPCVCLGHVVGGCVALQLVLTTVTFDGQVDVVGRVVKTGAALRDRGKCVCLSEHLPHLDAFLQIGNLLFKALEERCDTLRFSGARYCGFAFGMLVLYRQEITIQFFLLNLPLHTEKAYFVLAFCLRE